MSFGKYNKLQEKIYRYYIKHYPSNKIKSFLKSIYAYKITTFLYYYPERVRLLFAIVKDSYQIDIIKYKNGKCNIRIYSQDEDMSLYYTDPNEIYPFIYFLLVKSSKPKILISFRLGNSELIEINARRKDCISQLLKDIDTYDYPKRLPFKIKGMAPSNKITDFILSFK